MYHCLDRVLATWTKVEVERQYTLPGRGHLNGRVVKELLTEVRRHFMMAMCMRYEIWCLIVNSLERQNYSCWRIGRLRKAVGLKWEMLILLVCWAWYLMPVMNSVNCTILQVNARQFWGITITSHVADSFGVMAAFEAKCCYLLACVWNGIDEGGESIYKRWMKIAVHAKELLNLLPVIDILFLVWNMWLP